MEPVIEIIPVVLEDGTQINVEAAVIGGEQDVAFEVLPFDEVSGAIESIAKAVMKPLQKIKPTKASVELGVAIGLEAGQLTALIVKGTGTANLKITLEWEDKDLFQSPK